MLKVGFAGEELPRAVFPAIVVRRSAHCLFFASLTFFVLQGRPKFSGVMVCDDVVLVVVHSSSFRVAFRSAWAPRTKSTAFSVALRVRCHDNDCALQYVGDEAQAKRGMLALKVRRANGCFA